MVDAIIVHASEFKALVLNMIVKTNTGANVIAPFFRVSFSKDKGAERDGCIRAGLLAFSSVSPLLHSSGTLA